MYSSFLSGFFFFSGSKRVFLPLKFYLDFLLENFVVSIVLPLLFYEKIQKCLKKISKTEKLRLDNYKKSIMKCIKTIAKSLNKVPVSS